MKKYLHILILFLFHEICTASETVAQNSTEISQALNSSMYTPNYLSMFLGLLIVICLIYLTGFLYQKMIKIKLQDTNGTNRLEIVSSISLGQGKNLHIIKVNNELILIGATQNNISYIKTLENSESQEISNGKNS